MTLSLLCWIQLISSQPVSEINFNTVLPLLVLFFINPPSKRSSRQNCVCFSCFPKLHVQTLIPWLNYPNNTRRVVQWPSSLLHNILHTPLNSPLSDPEKHWFEGPTFRFSCIKGTIFLWSWPESHIPNALFSLIHCFLI